MQSIDAADSTGSCVEFVFRVHSDGRRERFARVLVRGRDGSYELGPARPEGKLAQFAARAVKCAIDELSLSPPRPRRR